MSVIPSLSYTIVIHALKRAGFLNIKQEGSHIRLIKVGSDGTVIKLVVPAYKPIPKHILAKILKQAGLTIEEFNALR